MPVCPKCHKEISDRKFERHLKRCGTSHRRSSVPSVVPSATPSFYWGDYSSGYHGERKPDKDGGGRGWLIYVVALLCVAGASILLYMVLR